MDAFNRRNSSVNDLIRQQKVQRLLSAMNFGTPRQDTSSIVQALGKYVPDAYIEAGRDDSILIRHFYDQDWCNDYIVAVRGHGTVREASVVFVSEYYQVVLIPGEHSVESISIYDPSGYERRVHIGKTAEG